MEFHDFSAVQADEWDRFVHASPDAWLFHLSPWIELETSSARSVSFMVTSGAEPVAICPLFLTRRKYAGVLSLNVLHTGRARSGPALAPNLAPKRSRDILRAIFQRIDDLARTHRVDRLELRLPTLAPSSLPPLRQHYNWLSMYRPFEPLVYGHSLRKGGAVTQIISLAETADQLWANLKQECRTAIRKAQQGGVTVSAATSSTALDEFRAIQADTYSRTGATMLPAEFTERMWSAFQPSGCLELLRAEYSGEPIAGQMILKYKDAATYWAGGSLAQHQHLRPSNLLMWEAISCARQRGLKWFEVGPTFPYADPDAKVRTIGMFKEHFGGQPYTMYEGSFSYRPIKTGIVDLLHGGVTQFAGRTRRKES
jgi:lipid II:glycine glycyltransferase (peptidoglycan interpeptide bridge formation enzyme)